MIAVAAMVTAGVLFAVAINMAIMFDWRAWWAERPKWGDDE